MLADNDFDVDADFAGPAENFDHASRWREAALRKARHFHVHNGAIQFRKPRAAVVAIWRTIWLAPSFCRNSGVSSSPGGIKTSWRMRVS